MSDVLQVAIAAPHHAATAAAERAVAAGGNAFDAALAAAAVLTVVYPHQCALGGDLIAVVREPGMKPRAILSAGACAAGMDVDAVRDSHDRMPGRGPLSVTVPGIVAGWQAIADCGAALPLSSAFGEAAEMAERGVDVSAGLHRALNANADVLRADDGARQLFFKDSGVVFGVGDQLVQAALGRTLRILARSPRDFYEGEVADRLVDGLRTLGSPLRTSDFAAHRAQITEAVQWQNGGVDWFVAPAPSQGAALLAVLGESSEVTDSQLLSRSIRVSRVRDAILADPAVVDVDISRFFDAADGRVRIASSTSPGMPKPQGDTVAVTAVDSDGRAVTLVQSVYQSFGSGIVEPVTGVLLHSRGSAFSLDSGHPAMLRPGTRPPHTLSPVIALGRGEVDPLVLALGCQGGRAQPWILAQVAAAVADPRSGDLAEVLGRNRWVFGGVDIGCDQPTVVTEDTAMQLSLAEAAKTEGFEVSARGARWDEAGHVQVARLSNGVLHAASDPRADGMSVVAQAADVGGATSP
ncbi:gamma-glutamyltransferase [Rhodococcus sp. IEGM 1379]|uniref:gamma-glutamyltransferase n=1 Tax=Rhodococcus sp. IEGM 1379 TaxID=3047086 RepID=UPI0024B86DF5|nr:gamma-glutamyltransferase [Rhodococcus sp. IEGM 1379]MDI9913988.1 gamma-glutamyltransferase [Rhodococcus sp. IEGM 1379]